MADKPPKKRMLPVKSEAPDEEGNGSLSYSPSEEDLAALDEFCDAFELEEIEFEAFCSSNNHLDLKLFIHLTPEECATGGSKEIEFTRTIKNFSPTGESIVREKVSIEVTWEKGACCGDVICIAKVGDRDNQANAGDLYVTIKAS